MFYPEYFIYVLKYQYFTDGDVSMCCGLAGRCVTADRRGGWSTADVAVLTSALLQRSHVS